MRIHESPSTNQGFRCTRGVTLIEMIVVILITGIIGSMVVVFMRRPMDGYLDTARRAELSDIADTALRRISRDLRRALPNSVRVTAVGNATYLEYLQTSGGGRYRADVTSTGAGDPLDFTAPDTSFDVLGPMPSNAAINDLVVIYNLGPGSGTTDAYQGAGGNSSAISNIDIPGSKITITSKLFPFASPGNRFQTVSGPVTYFCDPDNGNLRRISGYAVTSSQPTNSAAAPLSTATSNVLLATSVTSCTFTYTSVTQRAGSVAMSLQVAQSGESVRLFQQINISNVP